MIGCLLCTGEMKVASRIWTEKGHWKTVIEQSFWVADLLWFNSVRIYMLFCSTSFRWGLVCSFCVVMGPSSWVKNQRKSGVPDVFRPDAWEEEKTSRKATNLRYSKQQCVMDFKFWPDFQSEKIFPDITVQHLGIFSASGRLHQHYVYMMYQCERDKFW